MDPDQLIVALIAFVALILRPASGMIVGDGAQRTGAARTLSQAVTSSAFCGDSGWVAFAGGRAASWSCVVAKQGALVIHWQGGSNGSLLLGITASPSASTQGKSVDWVGVGLAESGGMPGADILLLRRSVPRRTQWVLEDRHATGYALPVLDQGAPEKALVRLEETSKGVLRAVVRLPLQPCDIKEDRPIFPGPLPVIYAFGTGAFGYHGLLNRGDITVALLPWDESANTTSPAQAAGANVTSISVTMPRLEVPVDDTDVYMCVDVELPVAGAPMHLIGFTEVVNTSLPAPGLGRVVHHTVLYNCTTKPATFGTGPYRCERQPEACATYVLVAAGVPYPVELPAQAGFRVGRGHMRYTTLQVHYSNPTLAANVRDASGFKISLTSALRPHDMGVLALGWESFQIPGSSTNVSLGPAICPGACTKRFSAPINVVANMLHMHKAGVSMATQHVRSGNELRPFARIDQYQFRFQPVLTVAPDARLVNPGDALITTCRYTTPDATPVDYGFRSSDEMCYSYLWFWPLAAAQGVSHCTSQGFLTGALPVCGSSQAPYDLARLLTDPSVKTQADARAAVRKALERGILVYADVNATMAFKPFNPTPAACPRGTVA